ncbi:hypothetical protein KQH82_02530 [bacterium]|nr:hypothetical protein [bacterium]
MVKRIQVGFAALFAFSLSLAGACDVSLDSEPVTKEEVFGVWVADYDAGLIDSIIVCPNGTYRRWYTSYDHRSWLDSGRFHLQYDMNYGKVDSTRLSICFAAFIDRFPVEPFIRKRPSDDSDAIVDSLPREWITYIYKERGGRLSIARGGHLEDCYFQVADVGEECDRGRVAHPQ